MSKQQEILESRKRGHQLHDFSSEDSLQGLMHLLPMSIPQTQIVMLHQECGRTFSVLRKAIYRCLFGPWRTQVRADWLDQSSFCHFLDAPTGIYHSIYPKCPYAQHSVANWTPEPGTQKLATAMLPLRLSAFRHGSTLSFVCVRTEIAGETQVS